MILRAVLICLLAGGLSFSAVAAGSGDDTQTVRNGAMPDKVPVAPASDKSKLICKNLPPPTGTRLGRRHVCMTQLQWNAITKRGQEAGKDIQDHGLLSNPPGS